MAAATLEVMSRTRLPTGVMGPLGLTALAGRALVRAGDRRREVLSQIADEVRDLVEATLWPALTVLRPDRHARPLTRPEPAPLDQGRRNAS